jgi:CRP-like cAMP-binding protein
MHGKAELAGDLRFVGLPDLFQILGGNNNTGILYITSQYAPTPGLIYFINGNPVDASCGPLIGLDAIYALFGWTEGKFEFCQQAVQVQRMVSNSRMEIILDALRMLDDGIIKKVGPPSLGEVSVVQSSSEKDALPVIKGPLVNYMYIIDEEEFFDGERIVVEGAHGNWIWVILEGEVEITRQTSNGPMTIARLGEGSTIGTIRSLVWREHVRSATATAVGNVQLGVLDTENLSEEYARLTSQFKELLLSMDARLGKVTDTAVELFMKENKAHGLIGDKKVVINEGLFTITEGEAYVVRLTPQGYLSLLTLKRDDVFGYAPFMDIGHELRCGSVIASKDLRINRLDTDSLRKEYDRLSPVFKGFIENVATCVSLTTRLVGKAD